MSGSEPSLVFDLDGTLIDSVPQVRWAMNRVLADKGLRPLTLAEVTALVGGGARAMFDAAFAMLEYSCDENTMSGILDRYLEAYLENPKANTVIYPHAMDVLAAFRSQGIPMGICTNKPGRTTRAVLDALGLGPFFSAVVTADDVAHRKPDGRHVLDTLSAMGVGPEGAFMIGDSEVDIAAGKNADIKTIAVTWGYCHVPIGELLADGMVDSFAEIPERIKALHGSAE